MSSLKDSFFLNSVLENSDIKEDDFKHQIVNKLKNLDLEKILNKYSKAVNIRSFNELLAIKQPVEKSASLVKKNNICYFINGRLSLESSLVNGCELISKDELKSKYDSYLRHRNNEEVKLENNSFALLNAVLEEESAAIFVSEGYIAADKIEIHSVFTQNNVALSSRLYIYVGAGANVVFELCRESNTNTVYENMLIDIVLETGATCKVLYNENIGSNEAVIKNIRVDVRKNANFRLEYLIINSERLISDTKIRLLEQHATAEVKGLWVLKLEQQLKLSCEIFHLATQTFSKQKFKGLLDDKAKAEFIGNVNMNSDAVLSDSSQKCDQMLLSDRAYAYCQPNLQIDIDDVKAAHGVSIGPVNGEQLAYLVSRGISTKRAKHLLSMGFLREFLNDFDDKLKNMSEKVFN